MALGSNRDYGTWHKRIMKRMKEAGYIKLWTCPKCGRKNAMGYHFCPRCNTPQDKNDPPEI